MLFASCQRNLTGAALLNLHIYCRPCIGLVLECGFLAIKLSSLPGFAYLDLLGIIALKYYK
jgi:hypothetical protein